MVEQDLLSVHERFVVVQAKSDDCIPFDLGMQRGCTRDFQQLLGVFRGELEAERELQNGVARRVSRPREKAMPKRTVETRALDDSLWFLAARLAER